MAYRENKGGYKKGGRRRRKVCVFCGKDNVIDYKDTAKLRKYISERGKILPRRVTESDHCCDQESPPRSADALRTGLISISKDCCFRTAVLFCAIKSVAIGTI